MITIYDLLEIQENASKEEIEKAYFDLTTKYKIDEKNSQEQNNDNRIILEKLKLAYEILMDDEKRKKYDANLANKRAEELIKNVQAQTDSNKQEESSNKTEEINTQLNNIQENTNEELTNINNTESNNTVGKYKRVKKQVNNKEAKIEKTKKIQKDIEDDDSNLELTKSEKNKIKKAAQKEFEKNLKKAQKAEDEYNKAYNEAYNRAYNNYLKKMGFSVKEPWTLLRVRTVIIRLFIVICICIVLWMLPITRSLLIQLYEENFIIKSFVDIAKKFINIIISIFK